MIFFYCGFSVRPSVDYSDDEENASDSDPDGDNLEYYTR